MLHEDFGGFMIMRLSDVNTDVEANFSGKEIKRLTVLESLHCH